jgi:copper chaperone CopZ
VKFASATQIIVMVVVITVACYAVDYYKNPQLWHRSAPAPAGVSQRVHLTLWMNHLCCSSCLDAVHQALSSVPGVDSDKSITAKQLLTRDQADKATASLPDYGNAIDLPVIDLDKIDFVALDRALRDKGLVAGRMELGGVEHFRLAAKIDHLCCGMCDRATQERMAFLKARSQGGQLKWLDSVTVDHENKTILAHARFLQAGKTVDVTELLGALNDIGFAPRSVHVLLYEHPKLARE